MRIPVVLPYIGRHPREPRVAVQALDPVLIVHRHRGKTPNALVFLLLYEEQNRRKRVLGESLLLSIAHAHLLYPSITAPRVPISQEADRKPKILMEM
jgi:hypothetical protein